MSRAKPVGTHAIVGAACLALVAVRLQPALGAEGGGATSKAPPETLIDQAYDAIESAKNAPSEAARRRQRERALKLCEEALATSPPVPQTYMCLGAAYQALSRWDQAELAYLRALESPDDPHVQKFRARLEKALADVRAYLGGTLEITGAPDGTRVSINGHPAGTTPLAAPIYVPAGEATLELQADGYRPQTGSVTIEISKKASFTAALVKLAAVAPPPPSGVVAPLLADTAAPASPPARAPDLISTPPPAGASGAPADRSHLRRNLALVSFGAATGALALGIGFHVAREGRASRFNGMDACDSSVAGSGSPQCASLADGVHSATTWAVVGYAAAAILGGTGAVLLLGAPARDASTHALSLRCGVAPQAIACGSAF
jgi:hypothetical protein